MCVFVCFVVLWLLRLIVLCCLCGLLCFDVIVMYGGVLCWCCDVLDCWLCCFVLMCVAVAVVAFACVVCCLCGVLCFVALCYV